MNGITGPLDVEDAWAIAGMLVKLKRAVHPATWVDEMIAEAQGDRLRGLL